MANTSKGARPSDEHALYWLFFVLVTGATVFWGFDIKQIVRDVLPLALGIGTVLDVFYNVLWYLNHNIVGLASIVSRRKD